MKRPKLASTWFWFLRFAWYVFGPALHVPRSSTCRCGASRCTEKRVCSSRNPQPGSEMYAVSEHRSHCRIKMWSIKSRGMWKAGSPASGTRKKSCSTRYATARGAGRAFIEKEASRRSTASCICCCHGCEQLDYWCVSIKSGLWRQGKPLRLDCTREHGLA